MIRQSDDRKQAAGLRDNTGMWTRDGLAYFSVGEGRFPPPIHYLSYLDGLRSLPLDTGIYDGWMR